MIVLKSIGNTSGYAPGYKFSGKAYETVHGSLSDYESNVPFAMFVPNATPEMTNNINLFLNRNLNTMRLSTQLNTIFVQSVINTREVFMEQ